MRFSPVRNWFWVRCCAASLVLGGLVANVEAVEPTLGQPSPNGFQRGKETLLNLGGTRLADAKEILFFSPGFTSEFVSAKDDGAEFKVTAAPDMAPGIYALRVRTATGITNLKTILVGHLPDETDVEPNNSFDKPQAMGLNLTVNGNMPSEDSDFFAVELKKGDCLTAEVEGLRLGHAYFDPYVAIYDVNKVELSRSDDAPLLYSDSLCSIVAPADGKYLVLVREASLGIGGGKYRLHLGTFPRPTAVFPPGGKPGETIQAKWIGDARGEFTTSVSLPADGKPEAALFAENDRGRAPSANVVRVNDLNAVNELEPNDAPLQALLGTAPGAMNGIIEKTGDVDHFKFAAKKGQTFDVRFYGRLPFRSPLDSVMSILNDQGNSLASNDDNGGNPDSYVRFTVPADGEFTIAVRDQLARGGANFVYRVEITEAKPTLTFGTPDRQLYVANTIVLPKNNRMALMVSAQRANFGSALQVEFPGLPPGVTAEALPHPEGATDIPVILTASADAAPAGALVGVTGKSTDANVPVDGKFNQRTMLIRGQNNRDVWGYSSDKLAMVVAEEIPFKVEIIAPKAPLPRNGSMDLKVKATRAPDFKAPIAISMVYNPAGVSSSVSAVIPENQDEGTIPLTANATAALGSIRVVAFAKSAHGGGNVECATPFSAINIVESFHGLTLPKGTIEQGKENQITAAVENKAPFEGNATAELKGLPNGVTSEPVEFNKDSKEIVFQLKAAADARVGKYTTLVCVITQKFEGEPVSHTLANGELRIDPPTAPKTGAAGGAGAPAKKPASRLEQLRQEKK